MIQGCSIPKSVVILPNVDNCVNSVFNDTIEEFNSLVHDMNNKDDTLYRNKEFQDSHCDHIKENVSSYILSKDVEVDVLADDIISSESIGSSNASKAVTRSHLVGTTELPDLLMYQDICEEFHYDPLLGAIFNTDPLVDNIQACEPPSSTFVGTAHKKLFQTLLQINGSMSTSGN